MSYRILVTGARDWDSPIAVRTALDLQGRLSRHAPNEVIVVHGGARGADVMAHEGAKALGCQVEVHLAADHPDPSTIGLSGLAAQHPFLSVVDGVLSAGQPAMAQRP